MRQKKPEKVKLLPFSARFTPSAKGRLEALAFSTKEHAYVILEKAFWEYWENLPEPVKSKAERIAAEVEEEPSTS
jgi:hypothetical protein